MTAPKFHDSLYRLAQIGTTLGVQLVRLVQCLGGNQYTALPVEFASSGKTQVAENQSLTVLNLAEPANQPGELPPDTEAVAIDVEGKWVIFVRLAPPDSPAVSARPARIVGPEVGQAQYRVCWQSLNSSGQFQDTSELAPIAVNLAELSFGRPAAVDINTIVLVHAVADTAGITRYLFDHPAYAKYLD